MEKKWLFDSTATQNYTKVREAFAHEFLASVRQQMNLVSALDVGCGVGYFSKFLVDEGFRVVAIDGRDENIQEAKKRHADIRFLTKSIEDKAVSDLGKFDFVLCVGLLYHLENPFLAIRHLYTLTDKVLLVESMCVPSSEPTMDLLDEAVAEDQGLSYLAFYPSESCLVKMLHRVGFPFVYRFNRLPNHTPFATTPYRKRSRTLLAASRVLLTSSNVAIAPEPFRMSYGDSDPWNTRLSLAHSYCRRKLNRVWSARRLLKGFLKTPNDDAGAR